jgi:hypothetical protein
VNKKNESSTSSTIARKLLKNIELNDEDEIEKEDEDEEMKKQKIIVEENAKKKNMNKAKERARQIHRRLNSFPSPYDRYVATIQQKQQVQMEMFMEENELILGRRKGHKAG